MTTQQTPTLATWLLAQIATDEAVALDAAGWDWSGRERASGRWLRTGISSLEDEWQRSVVYSDNHQVSGSVADHIARQDPAHVLATCAAHRAIVEVAEGIESYADRDALLRALAQAYSDRDGFDPAWVAS